MSQNEHFWILLGSQWFPVHQGRYSTSRGVIWAGVWAELLQQLCLVFMKKPKRHGLKCMTHESVKRELLRDRY